MLLLALEKTGNIGSVIFSSCQLLDSLNHERINVVGAGKAIFGYFSWPVFPKISRRFHGI